MWTVTVTPGFEIRSFDYLTQTQAQLLYDGKTTENEICKEQKENQK